MILAAGLPVFLLAIFGLARMPIWWACLFLTMAIIRLVCWYHQPLCPTRHAWDYSVVFYGIIPSNVLTSLTIARQTRNHGKFLLAGKVWPFLGEIAQLKVRDARSIYPPGLGEVE